MIELNFSQILLYLTPILAFFFLYMLNSSIEDLTYKIPKYFTSLLTKIHMFLLFSFIIVTEIYIIYKTPRSFYYFVLLAALSVVTILNAKYDCESKKFNNNLIIITVIIIAVSIPSYNFLSNNMYGAQYPKNIIETESLHQHIKTIMNTPSYYVVPVIHLIQAPIALIMGLTNESYILYSVGIIICVSLNFMALLKKLSGKLLPGILSSLFIFAIPHLSPYTGEGTRVLSIIIGTVYLVIAFHITEKPNRGASFVLNLVSATMIFTHVVGTFAICITMLPRLIDISNRSDFKLIVNKSVLKLIMISVVGALTYWMFTSIILRIVVDSSEGIITSFLNFCFARSTGGGGYDPRYEGPGFHIFAVSWVIPAALSIAYISHAILNYILYRKISLEMHGIPFFTALIGGCTLFIGFFSYKVDPIGQYTISFGYYLLLYSSSFAAYKILNTKSKINLVLTLLLIMIFIIFGTYSPDWAPLEHQDFGAKAMIHSYRNKIEAESILSFINSGTQVIDDYDLPIGLGGLYKPTRNEILSICSGTDPYYYMKAHLTLLGLRAERFSNSIFDQYDIIWDTDYHRIIALIREER